MIKALVDLRLSFGPSRDQSPRPTCMAFAASDAHAAVRQGWQPLSTEWAYFHALKRSGGSPDDGTTLDAMLATIKSDGQPAETDWPYIKAPITAATSWIPPAPAGGLFYRDHEVCTATIKDIVDQLNVGFPVLLTMTVSLAFYRPAPDGTIEANEKTDPKRGHAVVAVGYGERGRTPFILIRNSWGESWGLNGYAWISVDYMMPRLLGVAIMTREL